MGFSRLARVLLDVNQIAIRGNSMPTTRTSMTVNPLFLRHDLLIELGRLEMAIEDAREQASSNDRDMISPLETKKQRINEALVRLSA